MKIQDLIAIVTGGASGLGAGAAELFVEGGARVMILDRDEAKGQALSATFGRAGEIHQSRRH